MSKKTMTSTAKMKKSDFERANKLLAIDDFEDLEEEDWTKLGVKEDSSELLYSTKFEDGTQMDVHLCSGQSNYYTEPTLRFKNGRIYTPEDAIGEFLSETEEFIIDGTTYVVKLEMV